MTTVELERKAVEIRMGIIDLVHASQVGHVGGALSSCDILTALYYQIMDVNSCDRTNPERDRFVLSKGHCVEGYYCILADKGFIEKEELASFCQFGTRLIAHPDRRVPGMEINTGALGHGLSAACGMAKAAKMLRRKSRVFVMMGDGEQGEGSIWEAAMFASNYCLDNLYGILDRNRLQISGPTEGVMRLEPLKEKWTAFGFHVEEIDGNDMEQIIDVFARLAEIQGKPKLILANTIKGKGVSFMEDQTKWHHGGLDDHLYQVARNELLEELRGLENG